MWTINDDGCVEERGAGRVWVRTELLESVYQIERTLASTAHQRLAKANVQRRETYLSENGTVMASASNCERWRNMH
jgi:hypothetical protein